MLFHNNKNKARKKIGIYKSEREAFRMPVKANYGTRAAQEVQKVTRLTEDGQRHSNMCCQGKGVQLNEGLLCNLD